MGGASWCLPMPAVASAAALPVQDTPARETHKVIGVRCEQGRPRPERCVCRGTAVRRMASLRSPMPEKADTVFSVAAGIVAWRSLVDRPGVLFGRGCLSLGHQLDCLVDKQFSDVVVVAQQRQPHAYVCLAPVICRTRHAQPRFRSENLRCSKTFRPGRKIINLVQIYR